MWDRIISKPKCTSQCIGCIAGHYSSEKGNTSISKCKLIGCGAGSYSSAKTNNTADGQDFDPIDRSETVDTDGDGMGDNVDTDYDNDGVSDKSGRC